MSKRMEQIEIVHRNAAGLDVGSREIWACVPPDREGKTVGVLDGPEPGKGRHFDPHQIALDKDKSIFAAEVLPWRVEKFRLK